MLDGERVMGKNLSKTGWSRNARAVTGLSGSSQGRWSSLRRCAGKQEEHRRRGLSCRDVMGEVPDKQTLRQNLDHMLRTYKGGKKTLPLSS